jgi:hypothetical protein
MTQDIPIEIEAILQKLGAWTMDELTVLPLRWTLCRLVKALKLCLHVSSSDQVRHYEDRDSGFPGYESDDILEQFYRSVYFTFITRFSLARTQGFGAWGYSLALDSKPWQEFAQYMRRLIERIVDEDTSPASH